MSNLHEFKNKVKSDKKLQKRINEASTIKDVVEIAGSAGYALTEDELRADMMEAVSGGVTPLMNYNYMMMPDYDNNIFGSGCDSKSGGMGNIDVAVKTGDISFSMLDFGNYDLGSNQTVFGEGNNAIISGNNVYNRGK